MSVYKYLDGIDVFPRDVDYEALKKQNRDLVLTLGVVVHAKKITHETLERAVDVLDLDTIIGALLKRGYIFVASDGYIPTKCVPAFVADIVEEVEVHLHTFQTPREPMGE